jgi:hypothetical protein
VFPLFLFLQKDFSAVSEWVDIVSKSGSTESASSSTVLGPASWDCVPAVESSSSSRSSEAGIFPYVFLGSITSFRNWRAVKCTHRGAIGCRLSPDFGFSSFFNSFLKLSLKPLHFVFATSSEKLYNIYVNIIGTHANMKLFILQISVNGDVL